MHIIVLGAIHVDMIARGVSAELVSNDEHQAFVNWEVELGGTGYNFARIAHGLGAGVDFLALTSNGDNWAADLVSKMATQQDLPIQLIPSEGSGESVVVLLYLQDNNQHVGRRVYGPERSPVDVCDIGGLFDEVATVPAVDCLYVDGYFLRTRAVEICQSLRLFRDTRPQCFLALELSPHSIWKFVSTEILSSALSVFDIVSTEMNTLERVLGIPVEINRAYETRLKLLSARISDLCPQTTFHVSNLVGSRYDRCLLGKSGFRQLEHIDRYSHGSGKSNDDARFAKLLIDQDWPVEHWLR